MLFGLRSPFSLRRTAARLAWTAAATATVAAASAQSYYLRNLPDFDQRRDALAGNGGMFCVPTSYANLLRFIALQGDGAGGLDGNCTGGYASVTELIRQLSVSMDTDTEDGTGFSDGFDAIVDRTEDRSNNGFLHVGFGSEGNWGRNPIKNYVAMGAMVRIGYGRYKREDGEWVRNGGHSVAVAGYDWRNSTDKYLLVADPASDDGNIDAQGSFAHDKILVRNITLTTEDDGQVTHARYGTWAGKNGDKRAVIDGMHVIHPLWFGWFDVPHAVQPTPETLWAALPAILQVADPVRTTFHAVVPNPLADDKNPVVREVTVDVPGAVKDWCVDMGDFAIYVLGEDGAVTHIDLLSKEAEMVAKISGAQKLTVAGKGFELFVLADGSADDRIVRVERETNKQTTLKVPKGIVAIEPDATTLGVAAIDPVKKRLFRIDPKLRSARPQAIAVPEGDGPVFLGLSRTGEATVARSGAATFMRAGSPLRINMARAPKIRSFQPIGKDRFLVQEGSKLTMVDAAGKPVASKFDAIQADGSVKVARSWKAFTKADVSGPKWRDVPPAPGEP